MAYNFQKSMGRFSYSAKSLACFVLATWLVDMLTKLLYTGIRGAARACLLKLFVLIFKSAMDIEGKAVFMLALSSFIHEPDGRINSRDIVGSLLMAAASLFHLLHE
ncbi:hypothetical protein ACET3Z_004930 [Daucus carota]